MSHAQTAREACARRDAEVAKLVTLRLRKVEHEGKLHDAEEALTEASARFEAASFTGEGVAAATAALAMAEGAVAASRGALAQGARLIEAQEATVATAKRDAGMALLALLRQMADAQADVTMRAVREAAASHRQWHRLAFAASEVAAAANLGNAIGPEPIPHHDPPYVLLKNHASGGIPATLRADGMREDWRAVPGELTGFTEADIFVMNAGGDE